MGEYDIYVIKLTSGEEIISRLEQSSESTWVLHEPRTLVATQNGGFGFAPVIFSSKKESLIYVKTNNIAVYSASVRPEFEEAYKQAVSGLALPKRDIILG